MNKEEAKNELCALECKVICKAIAKLESMTARLESGEFILVNRKPCELAHIQECVKLAHQVRSLLN